MRCVGGNQRIPFIIRFSIMKTTVLLALLIFCNISFAQNYHPISKTSHKRFVNAQDPNDADYFSFVTDTTILGDEIVYHQYLRKSNYYTDVSGTFCAGWGGGIQPKADTTWLGRKQIYNSVNKTFTLWNSLGDTLNFDFGLALGDSAVFYTDQAGSYYLRYDSMNSELVIDSVDNVKTFTIWKYDALNNQLASNINGFSVRLSEKYGLVSFIECDQFPLEEKGLNLMGQVRPNLGYYQLTKEEVYPWQIGDSLQYEGRNNNFTFGGPVTISYITLIITNRIETADSVWIYFDTNTQIEETPAGYPFPYPTPYNIQYSNPITFAKSDPITEFPNKSVLAYSWQVGGTNWMDTIDTCGSRRQYNYAGDWQFYCDSCDCWTEGDGNGTTRNAGRYTEGLGMTFKKTTLYGEIANPKYAELVYFNVAGVSCGNYVPLSVSSLYLTAGPKELVQIVDVLGRVVEHEKESELYIYQYSDGTSEKKVFVE